LVTVAIGVLIAVVLYARYQEQQQERGALGPPALDAAAQVPSDSHPTRAASSAETPLPTTEPPPDARPSPSSSTARSSSRVAPRSTDPSVPAASKSTPSPAKTQPSAADDQRSVIVKNVTLKDQNGRVIYRGDMDLQPTLDRIARREFHEHRNDGGTFRNLEGRLPRKPTGYYREYVVPTPRYDGPGPQRLVIGREGEIYYTHDHYRSFKRIQ
jgi:guanyl-specific ribonuclease Sa